MIVMVKIRKVCEGSFVERKIPDSIDMSVHIVKTNFTSTLPQLKQKMKKECVWKTIYHIISVGFVIFQS